MIVFIGLPRTGTLSICSALTSAGKKVFHGCTFAETCDDKDVDFFASQLDSPDLDSWKTYFQTYDVISDLPSLAFLDLTREAFPDAQYILTCRDIDSWQQSWAQYMACSRAFLTDHPQYKPKMIKMLERVRKTTRIVSDVSFDDASLDVGKGRTFYRSWETKMMEMFPNCIKVNIAQKEDLCSILGIKEVPHINTRSSLVVQVKRRWK